MQAKHEKGLQLLIDHFNYHPLFIRHDDTVRLCFCLCLALCLGLCLCLALCLSLSIFLSLSHFSSASTARSAAAGHSPLDTLALVAQHR